MPDIKLVKFPTAPKETAKDVLAKALDADLSNVLVLSFDDEGTIHYFESPEMTIAQANWLCDCYKHFLQTASEK